MPNGYLVRLRYGRKRRVRLVIPMHNARAAAARAEALGELAAQLAEQPDGQVRELLRMAAEADDKGFAKVVAAVAKVASRGTQRAEQAPHAKWTLQQLGEAWTSGALAKEYPDTVRARKDARVDISRLQAHVYPVVGDVLVKAFGLRHYELVMRSLEGKRPTQRKLSPLSRRSIALTLTRLLSIAVYPLKILAAHPVPKGAVPHAKRARAYSYLYPDEDMRLMACAAVPLPWRALWGFLVREGCRVSEALGLRWDDVDLTRGVVRLDKNKTDDPRVWVLSPGVGHSLEQLRKSSNGGNLVFPQPPDPFSMARDLRLHLVQAGVKRKELLVSTTERMALRVHDLRGSFVTIALANGRSEAWVCDRTGHRSSQMIATYKRAARTASELALGDWAPLDAALGVGQGVGQAINRPADQRKKRRK